MTREHLHRRARAVFGTDHQIAKAREEAAELVLAICHRERDGDDALVEECADVEITNAQLRLILGADRVDAMVAVKLARLEERVAAAEVAACPHQVGDAVDVDIYGEWRPGIVTTTESDHGTVHVEIKHGEGEGMFTTEVWLPGHVHLIRQRVAVFPEVPTKPSKVVR